MPVSELATNSLWTHTASRVEQLMRAQGHSGSWQQSLLSQGCAAVPASTADDTASVALRVALCSRDSGLKPMTALCPLACGCTDTYGAVDCPAACSTLHCTEYGWQHWP
eukprot:4222342-Amphidinium_carterae.1